MVDSTMDRLSWVLKQVEEADTNLLREMVKLFVERVMARRRTRSAAPHMASAPRSGPTVVTAIGPGPGTRGRARRPHDADARGRDVRCVAERRARRRTRDLALPHPGEARTGERNRARLPDQGSGPDARPHPTRTGWSCELKPLSTRYDLTKLRPTVTVSNGTSTGGTEPTGEDLAVWVGQDLVADAVASKGLRLQVSDRLRFRCEERRRHQACTRWRGRSGDPGPRSPPAGPRARRRVALRPGGSGTSSPCPACRRPRPFITSADRSS